MEFSLQYFVQLKLILGLIVFGIAGYYLFKIKNYKNKIMILILLGLFMILSTMIHYNPAKENIITNNRIVEQDYTMKDRKIPKKLSDSFNYKKELQTYDKEVSQRQNKIHKSIKE